MHLYACIKWLLAQAYSLRILASFTTHKHTSGDQNLFIYFATLVRLVVGFSTSIITHDTYIAGLEYRRRASSALLLLILMLQFG